MTVAVIFLAILILAYANGANDNFKGVATLFGSGTTDYRGALLWAAVTTFLGSLTAVFLAEHLQKTFSGKGLVSDALVATPHYGAAVALGAGLTVLIATRVGMPISTTHSLIGALVGAGWTAGSTINGTQLSNTFLLPLFVSPLLAVSVTALSYPLLRWAGDRWNLTEQSCVCIGTESADAVSASGQTVALRRSDSLTVRQGDLTTCRNDNAAGVLGIDAASVLDKLHFLSAGLVSYARGLNDTPKIAAMLLLVQTVGQVGSNALVGAAIAVGGILSVRRVAETMSHKITEMNHGQGFAANAVTSAIVIGASWLGRPVSTTHVSCGSLFGIGATTGQAHWQVIGKILAAWLITLPAGAALGALAYWIIGWL